MLKYHFFTQFLEGKKPLTLFVLDQVYGSVSTVAKFFDKVKTFSGEILMLADCGLLRIFGVVADFGKA